MAELEAARQELLKARAGADRSRAAAVRANEELKRLRRELAAAQRVGDGRRVDVLTGAVRKAEEAVQQARVQSAAAAKELAGAVSAFAPFADPAAAVARLPDSVPIALFPLRLETRYQTRGQAQFLLVRAYPDDALVDTFQPEIAGAELQNAQIFWTHWWRAGGDEAGRRSAWAALVRAHGAGRAHWLLQQVKPSNPGEEPVAGASDHVLVILPAAPVPEIQKQPIRDFWSRIWSSQGADRDAAFAQLVADLGAARAEDVEATLQPVNLTDPAVKPDPSLHPLIAFLDLPQASTLPLSQAAWTRPARAWLLPERLMLLAYRDGKEVLRVPGEAIPAELQVGPDPSADPHQQLAAEGALQWMADFETARAQGMAFAVDLTARGVAPRFDLLLVLGVRSQSDPVHAATELSQLIADHQNSRKGFALLPQGRPTNNTDASDAGYSWWENPDDSYQQFFGASPVDDPLSWQRRKDGAWLAGMLGLDRAVLQASPDYSCTDQSEARAINAALWPATLGYYLEQMLEPVFSEQTVRATRSFFNRFVIGRGTVPLVRIGKQPYGILPVTPWSRMAFWTDPGYGRTGKDLGLPAAGYLAGLHELVERAVKLWRDLSARVSTVARPGVDPLQTLLDVVGLHPGTAELYQRYSQSFTQVYNALGFETQPVAQPVTLETLKYVFSGLKALSDLGWVAPAGGKLPEILQTIFLKTPNLLQGDVVQATVSETAPLEVRRADGQNYIAWLQSAARTSHDALRKQEGFAGGPPSSLLYLMLQHALDLGYVDTALSLRRTALNLPDTAFLAERREPKFIGVAEGGGKSRWESLYQPEPAITGDPGRLLGDYIASMPAASRQDLQDQLDALDVLKVASTAGLERALLEHIDCLSYRLDAWRSGLQAVQLSYMRRESANGFGQGGILLGAYGWVENLAPKDVALEPVRLPDDLAQLFEGQPLVRDPSNLGHVHAPSQDHALTAAILRSGYEANAAPAAPGLLAVELSSERVRLAQRVLEGIRNGQSLGALLGYQLERALHDVPNLFLDRLIYALRSAFPLVGNRNTRTRVASLKSITQVEARNVVDGEALLDHLESSSATAYPYGIAGLPPLSDFTGPGLPTAAQIGTIIDGCIDGLRATADAVADLGVSEGVYQVVRGNFDRAAGAMDAFSKGTYPPALEVCTTPRRGRTLTHRLALHLEAGLAPADGGPRPRQQGEPALARWLAGKLPDPAIVFARVSWKLGNTVLGTLTPSMADLGLSAADLFYLVDAGGEKELGGFDELLIDYAERNGTPPPRHDALFELEYKPASAGLTLFDLAPLVRALRGFVLAGRALRASDLSLQSEASRGDDATVAVRADKAVAVIALLQGTIAAVDAFVAALGGSIGEGVTEEAARDAARDHIDAWLATYAAAARPVAAFGLPAGGLSAGVEGRRPRLQAMLDALDDVIARWRRKQTEYDTLMGGYAGLTTDEERIALLIRAGRLVSAAIIAPIPPLPALQNAVADLRTAFDHALGELVALRGGATKVGSTLQAITVFRPSHDALDLTPLDLDGFRSQVRTLADDLLRRATALHDDIVARVSAANDALGRAGGATPDKAQAAVQDAARAVLGQSFELLPELTLSDERRAEWAQVWAHRDDLLAHLDSAYPLDDWLHGVARVRDPARNLELAAMLGEALGAAQGPQLAALQFPNLPGDSWAGLRFPDGYTPDSDKLLYTAVDASGVDAAFCGLLLDEWTEVVPTDRVTTGLTFHFDRPNSEAPQAILLATPPVQRGTWRFDDLVASLLETLDFARLRAVEPAQIDQSELAPLLPAVMSAVTLWPITAALNFAFNNNLVTELERVQT